MTFKKKIGSWAVAGAAWHCPRNAAFRRQPSAARRRCRVNAAFRSPGRPKTRGIVEIRPAVAKASILGAWPAALPCLMLLAATGCQTVPPLPAADLEEPGWTVRQGQAVWRRERGAPEIAGDFLVAWRGQSAFVQFSKPPFTLLSAQRTASAWEINVPAQNQRYSGRGKPPSRLIWLYLPNILENRPPPKEWFWQPPGHGHWRLENHKTGQSIEGYFAE
jgi:hypothetical protein